MAFARPTKKVVYLTGPTLAFYAERILQRMVQDKPRPYDTRRLMIFLDRIERTLEGLECIR